MSGHRGVGWGHTATRGSSLHMPFEVVDAGSPGRRLRPVPIARRPTRAMVHRVPGFWAQLT